jgi:Flp pilus assembly protein TadD
MALRLDPGDPVVNGLSGLGWKRQGKYGQALADYLQAARLEPQNAEWQAALGELQGLNGNLLAGLDAYQKATELAPDQAVYWRLLATFCADNAIQIDQVGLPAAKKAASLAPNDPAVLDALGWSYTQAGLLFNAEQNLQKAVKLNPRMALAHLHLAEMYLRKGDPESARAELHIATELDADGPVGSLASKLLKQYFP